MGTQDENGNDETNLPAVRLEVGFVAESFPPVVTLTEHGPISTHLVRMPADQAIQIGETLIRAAKLAKGGLVVPGQSPG